MLYLLVGCGEFEGKLQGQNHGMMCNVTLRCDRIYGVIGSPDGLCVCVCMRLCVGVGVCVCVFCGRLWVLECVSVCFVLVCVCVGVGLWVCLGVPVKMAVLDNAGDEWLT